MRLGRPACMVMNFLLANLDFQKTTDTGFKDIHLQPLSQGCPAPGSGPDFLKLTGKAFPKTCSIPRFTV